jgi:heme iron utilization protein
VDPKTVSMLRRLVTESRILTLAVQPAGELVLGVLPFLAESDLQTLVVHASRLAKHSRGLFAGAPFSAAMHEPDHPDADPLALPRLLFSGAVEAVADAERRRLESAWIERFPSAVMTLSLGDFAFHRLRIASGRLIAGFAQAYSIGPRQLELAAAQRDA